MPSSIFIKAGTVIFLQGEVGDYAYIVDKGMVEIFLEQDNVCTPVSHIGVGEIFGEMAIIDSAPRSASAKALVDCELTIISKEQLSERVTETDPIVRLLLTTLSKRLRRDIKKNVKIAELAKLKVDKFDDLHFLKTSSPLSLEESKTIDKIRFERELYNALTHNEFEAYYQPIINLKNNKTEGVEALIRWNSPKRGVVRPDIFMGVAEETSLIVPIGQWIVKEAFKQFSEMLSLNSEKFNPTPFLSINVSVRQFHDPKFLKILESSISSYKLNPAQVKLEITERVLLEGSIAMEWIDKCRKLGFSVAIDDFGTGYSSLRNLDQINIDYLKIDKSFIDKIVENKNTQVIVKSIIEMSKGLGFNIVAEGIETKEQEKLVKAYGVDLAQGYLFSRPLPMDQVVEFLLNSKSKKAA
ncbi:MAG: EAL domain-containing protein [Bdellovibrionales bacterium]|nr:EAL domain-containing protein [Bdellovibrionales bacterium]